MHRKIMFTSLLIIIYFKEQDGFDADQLLQGGVKFNKHDQVWC